MIVVLAPHGDDEILGCYSILHEVDHVVIFKDDYRTSNLAHDPQSFRIDAFRRSKATYHLYGGLSSSGLLDRLGSSDTLVIPSKYDLHPLHRQVNRVGLAVFHPKKLFYSVSMNVPWLEEEKDPVGKRQLFQELYPGEVETISKNDAYFLFKSIKPFDDLIWATIRFTKEGLHKWEAAPETVSFLRNLHRHMFYWQVQVQQFGDDRDLEYLMLREKVMDRVNAVKWAPTISCEQFALFIKNWLSTEYLDRLVRVSVFEDDENGAVIE